MSAVALLGTGRVEELRERMVPREATVGALALAWYFQIGELEGSVHRVSGMTEAGAVKSLILRVSRLTKVDYVRDSMLAELRSANEVKVHGASPLRVDVHAILGLRQRSVEDDDEEEAPMAPNVRHVRSRSPSFDEDRRHHY